MASALASKRLVVVTGGTRGIGQAIAQHFAELKYNVVITGRSAGENQAAQLRQQGVEAHFVAMDVSDENSVEQAFATIAGYGGCDVLVNNAGISKDFLLMRSKASDWQQIINVNLMGSLYCSRAAIKQMIKKDSGRIINISSIIGITGNSGQSVYAATKAALIGLTKSLAQEMASRNITVNAVAPGYIQTEMTDAISESVQAEYLKRIPLKRAGTPNDVAPLVGFLASDMAAYITGQVIGVDGGMH